MWSRSRLDIGWKDLFFGALGTFTPRRDVSQEIAQMWDPDGAVFLTVRTAWDALLAELALPPGEVVVSAINIPDMFDLIERHGLRPVPVDLDPATLAPVPGALGAAVNDETRLILVAHLLGNRVDMDTLYGELDRKGVAVPVVEDCAQAFSGPGFRGHPRSLAALFSFGPIKFSSALGGCLARVADPDLRRRMMARAQRYPRQRRVDYLKVVGQYATLKVLTVPSIYAAFVHACQAFDQSHDDLINGAVMGLKGDDYMAALHRRPSVPLLVVLERRLQTYDHRRMDSRREQCEWLADRVPAGLRVLGAEAPVRTWWQFAVTSEDPQSLIERLRAAGFDATAGASRLRSPVTLGSEDPTPRATAAMNSVVYIPAYPEIPRREVARLAGLIAGT